MATEPISHPLPARVFRVASVSYLNARPLIDGLDSERDVRLALDVPSCLLDRLRDDEADVALLPVIDYQRLPDARIIPSGGIGCDGATLTVRIFSRCPMNQITQLDCDTDSHTSVALAHIILAERYHTEPAIRDWTKGKAAIADVSTDAHTARLLIGDKVVCEEPAGYEFQLDLGAAWKELTGLPFVFAAWTTRAGINLADLPARLSLAKDRGLVNIGPIIERYAIPRGWPAAVAEQYLTRYLQFDIGERQLSAIRLFHELAARHGLISAPLPLRIYG